MESIEKQLNCFLKKKSSKESLWVIFFHDPPFIYFVILPDILDNEVVDLNMKFL